MLTYAFDPLFFERLVLRDLWWGGTGDILVVGDDQQLSLDLPRWRGETRHLGRHYHLARAAVAGAFHPKLILRVGADGGLVWIGSGNLTFGGWGANRELAAAWKVGHGQEDNGWWLRDLLSALLTHLGGGAARELVLAIQDVGWIRESAATEVPPPVLHSLGEMPLIDQLAARWSGRRFERAFIYTGSSDHDGKMLEQLAARFGVKEAQVIGTPGRLSFDPKALYRLPLAVRVQAKGEWPVLHAKFLWLDGPEGSACAFGSANASGAAWLRGPRSGGNAELIGVLDQPERAAFAELLGIFEGEGLSEVELGGHVSTEAEERVVHAPIRLRTVEYDAASGQVFVEFDGRTGDIEQVVLEDHGRPTSLATDSQGTWAASWMPADTSDTSRFVDISAHGRWGAPMRWSSWVHDLAELRHSSRGRTIEETLRKLGCSSPVGEEQRIVKALADISSALIAEPDAFRDAGSRRGSADDDAETAVVGRVDPTKLIRSLGDVDRHDGPHGPTSSHAPVSVMGVLRALFLAHEGDTEVEQEFLDEPDAGESPRSDERPSPREHVAPSETHRKRLKKQMERFIKSFEDRDFAQRATATQLVQAAAFPLAVGLLGRNGGWVDAEDADNWANAVFAILFERADADGRRGLFEEVRARFVAHELEDVFVRAVGDGTLWMALLVAIGGLRADDPRNGLRRCLALQALQRNQVLIAMGDLGRMRALVARMSVEHAKRLQEEVPAIVESFAMLEKYLADHESDLRALQAAPEFEHRVGDALWKAEVGWVECLEPAARDATARVFSHFKAREIPVKVAMYLNATQAARHDRRLNEVMRRALAPRS